MADESEEMVPKSVMLKRLAAKQAKVDELSQKVEDLKTFADASPSPDQLQKLQDQLAAVQSEYSDYRTQQETTATLYQAGITDPDVQDLVRYRHSKLGKDAPPLADWVSEGAASDPVLAPHLSSPAAAPAEAAPATAPQEAQAAAPAMVPPRTGKPAPAPGSGLTVESLATMSKAERLARRDEIWAMFRGE